RGLARPTSTSPTRLEPAGDASFAADVVTPGILDSTVLRSADRRAPGRGEVEIEVVAAGLNFIDVMLAMGVYPDETAARAARLGQECAGRVVRVGDGVLGLSVGDEVIGLGRGRVASHV